MAGHSKFKNIMHRKGAQDKKRATLFTKLVRELTVAASIGVPDPAFNPRLRLAMISAREANLPKERIENAIKKATFSGSSANYEDIRYEGYGPFGVAIIVETITDNRNRTASEMRSIFARYNGTLGETGSVSYIFSRMGILIYSNDVVNTQSILETAIEAGADDYCSDDTIHEIICKAESLHFIKEFMEKKIGEPQTAKLIWKPNTNVALNTEQAATILKLIDALEDSDDVQSVWANTLL